MLRQHYIYTLLLLGSGSTMAAGIPGLQGPDHVGLTVPDLAKAVAFFTDIIGCRAYYVNGPVKAEDNWMKENLNVDPRTELAKVTMVRCGHGSNIELFEYRDPRQDTVQPANSDIGGHHVGFLVNDIHVAVAYLRSHQVQVLGEPKLTSRGPTAGRSWVYFLAPWGTQMELTQTPPALPYEKEFGPPVLWSPAKPAE